MTVRDNYFRTPQIITAHRRVFPWRPVLMLVLLPIVAWGAFEVGRGNIGSGLTGIRGSGGILEQQLELMKEEYKTLKMQAKGSEDSLIDASNIRAEAEDRIELLQSELAVLESEVTTLKAAAAESKVKLALKDFSVQPNSDDGSYSYKAVISHSRDAIAGKLKLDISGTMAGEAAKFEAIQPDEEEVPEQALDFDFVQEIMSRI